MPPCGTVQGTALHFAVGENDEAGLVTSSLKHVIKSDKKEARNSCGNVVAVAYYNKSSEVTIEGLGTDVSVDVGDALSLANSFDPEIAGALFVDEVSVDYSNEDFAKVSIKATAYEGIPVDAGSGA